MSEQLIALDTRKTAMTTYTDDLYLGAQEAHKALWPGQTTPTDPADLGNDLQLSNVRVGEWRDSGARVGADEALTYFLSWYEKVDLETLCSVREGSMWTTDLELIRRRQELAHSYVTTPTLRSSSETFASRRRTPTLKMLKDLTTARMRKKLKMQAMPVLKL
jgi:hypothetical protein